MSAAGPPGRCRGKSWSRKRQCQVTGRVRVRGRITQSHSESESESVSESEPDKNGVRVGIGVSQRRGNFGAGHRALRSLTRSRRWWSGEEARLLERAD